MYRSRSTEDLCVEITAIKLCHLNVKQICTYQKQNSQFTVLPCPQLILYWHKKSIASDKTLSVMSLMWQHVPTSKCHLQASFIKYKKEIPIRYFYFHNVHID